MITNFMYKNYSAVRVVEQIRRMQKSLHDKWLTLKGYHCFMQYIQSSDTY